MPVVIPAGSVYVTAGTTRRATGTHYTPKSLTEPIVQHTLEPLVYIGPAEGRPRDKWKLKRPDELLDLKICDMAMGSGAFLVQVVRYLSERLVEAWNALSDDPRIVHEFTIEGAPPTGSLSDILIPREPDERIAHARRLIADRCIYGVDKNPLAVEMAKLSLWLITLEQNRAFTFLDHALKCGDSLVGVDLEQLNNWTLDKGEKPKQVMLGVMRIREQIDAVIKLRARLESFTVNDIRDRQEKARLHAEADARINDLRAAANLLLASYFNDYKKDKREAMRGHLLDVVQQGADVPAQYYGPVEVVEGVRPFHWQLEFPEVFLNGRSGFDGFVGNPPFIGGKRISTMLGTLYGTHIRLIWNHSQGAADLCAYFFLRALALLGHSRCLWLIATNTITQGATKSLGLDHILSRRGSIYFALKNHTWPGQASVIIDVVHIAKGLTEIPRQLNHLPVKHISAALDDYLDLGNPHRLITNKDQGFVGTNINGSGFVISPDKAGDLLERYPKNDDVLFPYLIGRDLNSQPDQSPTRWVINFFGWDLDMAETYPECLRIVTEEVKPFRDNLLAKGRQIHEYDYWKFWDKGLESYEAIAGKRRVICVARTSNTAAFAFVPTGIVYADATCVFNFDDGAHLACFQSAFHVESAFQHGSSLERNLNYTVRKVFETFPLSTSPLEAIGETYHEKRRQIMLRTQKGLTATYNRFHDPEESAADIQELRDLHVEMDTQVAAA